MKFRSHPRHKQILSYVMWDEIKQINKQTGQQGLYVWASPTNESVLHLQSLLVAFPERKRLENSTDYHCTVLYSKAEPEQPSLEFPPDQRSEIRARIVRFDSWEDHKGRYIIVARLESPSLEAYHRYFLNMGFTSDYPQYNPHITVAKDVQNDTNLHLWLGSVNTMLEHDPVDVTFHGILHGSALT